MWTLCNPRNGNALLPSSNMSDYTPKQTICDAKLDLEGGRGGEEALSKIPEWGASRIPPPLRALELLMEDLETSGLTSPEEREGASCTTEPPSRIGNSHGGLRNFWLDQSRMEGEAYYRIPNPQELEDLVSSGLTSPEYPLFRIGNSYGRLCVVDCCVETTAVSPKDTVSFLYSYKYTRLRR